MVSNILTAKNVLCFHFAKKHPIIHTKKIHPCVGLYRVVDEKSLRHAIQRTCTIFCLKKNRESSINDNSLIFKLRIRILKRRIRIHRSSKHPFGQPFVAFITPLCIFFGCLEQFLGRFGEYLFERVVTNFAH